MRTRTLAALLTTTCAILAACAVSTTEPTTDRILTTDACAAQFPHACVAADHYIASLAGAEILARGGNAVDAAVATSFTLSVVRPYSCGIGGGGFMVIYLAPDADHPHPREIALNYRETTPAAIDPLFYERQTDPDASTRSGAAAGIPGSVAGLLHALDHYGTLDRAAVLAPAIRAAREGFRADADLVGVARGLAGRFKDHPDYKTRFSFVWTRYLKEGKIQVGDLITNPEQAAALELIAQDGVNAFYRGPIAQAIVDSSHADKGVITLEDLAAYTPVELQPLRFRALGLSFLAMPPPSSGGVAMAETLTLLDMWEQSARPDSSDALVPRAHALAESFKHAFADRAEWLADPAFEPVPVQRLTSHDYLDALLHRFNADHTLQPANYGSRRSDQPAAPKDDHGTSHLSAVDRFGNAVACTETINLEFGSLLAVSSYGFCLNNEMDDFTTRRGEPNAFGLTQSDRNLPAPGKRPLSSMSPTIVLSPAGQVVAVAGASGGPRIITATTQVLLNTLAHDMDAGAAVAARRLHHQWMPDTLIFENAFLESTRGEATIAAMRARGHEIDFTDSIACVQLIRRAKDGQSWEAASDPRKGGRPAGH